MFHRESVSMNGELTWFTKKRFARPERHRCFVRTSNLSLDGTKIEIDGQIEFEIEERGRLQLGIVFSDVQIMQVDHTRDATLLRLVFLAPSTDFIAFVEENLPVITSDRERFEGKWI